MCSFIFEKTNFIMKGLGMRPLNVINPMRSWIGSNEFISVSN